MSTTALKSKNVFHILIIVGLLCIVAANQFDSTVYKVNVDGTLANLGALLSFIGGSQWLYEISVRQQMLEEITSLTVQNLNIVKSGIEDVITDPKGVDYSGVIRESAELTVGRNHSPRILDDYIDDFRERSKKKLDIKIVVLELDSMAGEYVSANVDGDKHIQQNLCKVQELARDIDESGSGKVEIFKHSTILKYSFVRSDTTIWIKPYRNSKGRSSKIPTIRLKSGTDLHGFFNSDIDMLVECASRP